MLYSDYDIRQNLWPSGSLKIEGMVEGSIQPASVDFHLSDCNLRVWKNTRPGHERIIMPWESQVGEMTERTPTEAGHWLLWPGEFALASCSERVEIPSCIAGRLEGKSSLARLGLIVHTTAGFFDPGFRGYPTLELLNVSPRPMALRAGMPIAQMSFFDLKTSSAFAYGGVRSKYQDQGPDPEPSHYDENFR